MMTDRERMIEIIKSKMLWEEDIFVPRTIGSIDARKLGDIADALIEAGFISLKKPSDMTRKTCDILRKIKDDEKYRLIKERDSFAHYYYIAKLALNAISETLSKVEGGCDEICPVWDNECIRLKSAVFCKEVKRSDLIAHCVEKWKQHALEEFLKPKEE